MADKEQVLILYNTPEEVGRGMFEESNNGIIKEVEAVASALSACDIPFRTRGIKSLKELPDILSNPRERVVVNLVEDLPQGPLDASLLPYTCEAYGKGVTGNSSLCLIRSLDKMLSKTMLMKAGLPCPPGELFYPGDLPGIHSLPEGPYIVKPPRSDASEGIDQESFIKEPGSALDAAVERVHKVYKQPALVECFVGTRELNVSVIQYKGRVDVLPIAEIEFRNFDDGRPKIVDYQAKWITDSFAYQNTVRVIPAPIDQETAERVRRIALGAWYTLGCRDYIRVDMRLDEAGKVYIIEVNPNPDISLDAGFASALIAGGIPFENFVSATVDNALGRRPRLSAIGFHAETQSESIREKTRVRYAEASDRERVLGLVSDTGFFRPDELEIAAEVFDDAVRSGSGGHYQSFVAEYCDEVVGWVCYGPTPCTVGTFDIYWIAVTQELQGMGFGRILMEYAESEISRRGGRLSVVETSGHERYASTQRFYLAMGYHEASRIQDFYDTGDDRVVYIKSLKA